MVNYDEWPVITCPEDLPEDGSLDRMFAEWLVATGAIEREDFEDQIRLTKANRSARQKSLEDLEAYKRKQGPKPDVEYNSYSKIFSKNGVNWAQRTTPFKRGRHRKD